MDLVAYMPEQAYVLMLVEEYRITEIEPSAVIHHQYPREEGMPVIVPPAPAPDRPRPNARILSFQPEGRSHKRAEPEWHANRYRGRSFHQKG